VIEKQYLFASEYSSGDDELTENIIRHRGSAGSDNVEIALRQTENAREVREARIHAGYNRDFGARRLS
jgi:hypothetical protein